MQLKMRHLFTMTITLEPPQLDGKTPYGHRRIVIIKGGTFDGERLKGAILPGGGDWVLIRNDGTLVLDVRLTLKTDDGASILTTYRGYRHGSKDVIERLNKGEAVDPSLYYFRINPLFETADERYGWLNNVVAIGAGERLPAGPRYTVYEVL
ncbi:MAG: DUF3237 domain-containing protein [Alphaproteobacteria bacterium]|nr:DUF3237 domain-containing protein [Alphaproteobacteria bacterium]